MPDESRATGEATWFHPNYQERWPLRVFSRSDINCLADRLSVGERERFLSLLALLQSAVRGDEPKGRCARERLDRAASLIRQEREELAGSLLSIVGQKIPVLAGGREAVLQFAPKALRNLAGSLMESEAPSMPQDADPKRVVSAEITRELRHLKYVLWSTSGRLQPALYSSTDLAAAYAFTLLGKWTGWEVCVNCGEFFEQSRPDKKWCTNSCGNRYRVRKSQAKKRAEGANAKKP